MTGEVRHTSSSAYSTFVALDREGKPQPIAPAIPETPEEVRRYQDAAVRRQHRLALRQ
jgi:acyl-CoA hydrolase